MKTKVKKTGKLKLYWNQSMQAWLVGTKPFKNKNMYSDRKLVEKLSRKMLRIGGTAVCVHFCDPRPFTETFIKHGYAFDYKSIILKEGEPSNCHQNAALLWKANQKKYYLCTGYGLSDDQMWRRHSWLQDKEGNIIETTAPRLIYFGIAQTTQSAKAFCQIFGE